MLTATDEPLPAVPYEYPSMVPRLRAVWALQGLGDPRAADSLVALVKRPGFKGVSRLAAAQKLGRMGRGPFGKRQGGIAGP